MEGREERKGHASLPAYLRRNTFEVTRVGSFSSFLPVMCWAGPEQAGVLFSCNGAQWMKGSSPAAACLGPCLWKEVGGPGSRAARTHPPPATACCQVSLREAEAGRLWMLAWLVVVLQRPLRLVSVREGVAVGEGRQP